MLNFLKIAAPCLLLAGCGSSYSPDTYATRAVQQANRVEQGVIIGVRQVNVSADGTAGAATGGALGGVVGGVAGAQGSPSGVTTAVGSIGGAVVGGLFGTAAEHMISDTTAYEYVVRNTRGELMSVTQKDATPLAVGQRVLLIAGAQARIVPDYTTPDAANQTPAPAGGSGAPATPANAAPAGTAPQDGPIQAR